MEKEKNYAIWETKTHSNGNRISLQVHASCAVNPVVLHCITWLIYKTGRNYNTWEQKITLQVHASRAVNPVAFHCWWKLDYAIWENKPIQPESKITLQVHASRAVNPVALQCITWLIYQTGKKIILHEKRNKETLGRNANAQSFSAGAPSGAVNPATCAILYRCTLLCCKSCAHISVLGITKIPRWNRKWKTKENRLVLVPQKKK